MRDAVSAGKVDWVIGNPEGYAKDGLTVDGETIPADIIVFATGCRGGPSLTEQGRPSHLAFPRNGDRSKPEIA